MGALASKISMAERLAEKLAEHDRIHADAA
jgi:hypothetical protein